MILMTPNFCAVVYNMYTYESSNYICIVLYSKQLHFYLFFEVSGIIYHSFIESIEFSRIYLVK